MPVAEFRFTLCPCVATTDLQFAEYIQGIINPSAPIEYLPASQDDPKKRRPDISLALRELNWSPKTDVKEGLKRTVRMEACRRRLC